MPKRSLTIFESAIKSPETKKLYMYYLDEFLRFIKIKDYDAVINLSSEKIQTHLENWVMHLAKKGLTASTIRGNLSSVELFLEMNKVLFYKKVIRKLVPSSDYILAGGKPFTTDDIKKFLKFTTKPRTKALVLFFSSTGVRPASIVDSVLRMKHLEDMPNGCKAVRIYEGSKEGYWAFLTPESTKALAHYHNSRKLNGEKLTSESPVFSNFENTNHTRKNPHMSDKSAKQIIQKLIRTAGVKRTKQGNRYDKASIYRFRKRFNTILKLNNDVNSNVAEKLMAHKNGLDGTYLQPTKKECFKEFSKAIEQLTIDSTQRQEIKIKSLEQEKSEIKMLNERIDRMEHYSKLNAELSLDRLKEAYGYVR